jgi:hypothetical protein
VEKGSPTALDQSSIAHFVRKVPIGPARIRARSRNEMGNPKLSTLNEYSGQAALSICEALLLALNDGGLLPEHEIVGVLRDAAATHENAVGTDHETENHRAVADLINAIIAGGNSVRRPQL